jgi:adenosylcobinamide-GDP ribazoletransferase
MVLAAVAMAALALLARRRLGGYTGDVLGAAQQAGEIVMLLAASV